MTYHSNYFADVDEAEDIFHDDGTITQTVQIFTLCSLKHRGSSHTLRQVGVFGHTTSSAALLIDGACTTCSGHMNHCVHTKVYKRSLSDANSDTSGEAFCGLLVFFLMCKAIHSLCNVYASITLSQPQNNVPVYTDDEEEGHEVFGKLPPDAFDAQCKKFLNDDRTNARLYCDSTQTIPVRRPSFGVLERSENGWRHWIATDSPRIQLSDPHLDQADQQLVPFNKLCVLFHTDGVRVVKVCFTLSPVCHPADSQACSLSLSLSLMMID